MHCPATRKMIPLFVEGDLDGAEERDLRAHLQSCAGCRRSAEEFRVSQQLLRSDPVPEFSAAVLEELTGAVMRQIESGAARNPVFARSSFLRPLFAVPRPAYALAALCLVLVLAATTLVRWRLAGVPAPETASTAAPAAGISGRDAVGSRDGARPAETIPQLAETAGRRAGTGGQHTGTGARRAGAGMRRVETGASRATTTRADSAAAVRGHERTRREAGDDRTVALVPGEQTYRQAIARLSDLLESGGGSALTPELRAEYRSQLMVVDRVLAETRRAALRRPGDPDAADYVIAAYRGKLTLLTAIASQSGLAPASY